MKKFLWPILFLTTIAIGVRYWMSRPSETGSQNVGSEPSAAEAGAENAEESFLEINPENRPSQVVSPGPRGGHATMGSLPSARGRQEGNSPSASAPNWPTQSHSPSGQAPAEAPTYEAQPSYEPPPYEPPPYEPPQGFEDTTNQKFDDEFEGQPPVVPPPPMPADEGDFIPPPPPEEFE